MRKREIYKVMLSLALAATIGIEPLAVSAATGDLKVSGWIPYWRVAQGTADAREHLEAIDTIHPFVFTVKEDGSLNDMGGLRDRDWTRLFSRARREDVEVIPTVMWSNGTNIHRILSDEDLREEHVEGISKMVRRGKYDGVDIDYEAKKAETREYFSQFLEELKEEIGDGRILSCTIEARTPPESLYATVPANLEYANDLEEIGEHCDRVQVMAYDQGRADIKLNVEKAGLPYIPVSDVDWVRKVVRLMTRSIPAEKMMLGVATYGYEYEMTASPNRFAGYSRLWSFNPGYAVQLAEDINATPSRNRGGELSLSYFATSSPYSILNTLPAPAGTASGDQAAAKALLFANATGMTVPFNYMVWSDAGAIQQKMDLAEEYDLRGIAIFKIDGGEDRDIWNDLE